MLPIRQAKKKLAEDIVALKIAGDEFRVRFNDVKGKSGMSKWNEKRKLNSDMRKFKQSVHLLESDFEALNVALKQRGENPFYSYCKVVLGGFCTILSTLWYVHIIIYMILPQLMGGTAVWSCLDGLFLEIAKVEFYGLDLILYAFLVGYLLICQMIGCFRFNLRVSECVVVFGSQF